MDPADIRVELIEEIKEGLIIVASGHPIPKIGDTLEQLSACFQSLAICHLLESAETPKYRDNLARSAFARRYFLSRSVTVQNVEDRRLALSRTEAFFDALAAGHGLLAREIASLSLMTWREGWEYQDDFLYFFFLHRIVMDPAWLGQPDSQAALKSFEEALDGNQAPRLGVLSALTGRDESLFNDSLRALMIERDAELQERKTRLLEPDFPMFLHWPRTYVSVEGLALIAIARAMRMNADDDIPLCPPLARLPLSVPAVEDPFAGIENELRQGRG